MGVTLDRRGFNREQSASLGPVYSRLTKTRSSNDKWFLPLLRDGGYAFLQSGDYYLYGNLVLDSDEICLVGEGRGATIHFRDRATLTITGNRARLAGIRFARAADYTLPTAFAGSVYGLTVSGDYSSVDECAFEGPEMGLKLMGNQASVTSNLFRVLGPMPYANGDPEAYASILIGGNGNAVSGNRVTTLDTKVFGSFNGWVAGTEVGNCIVGNVGYIGGVALGQVWYSLAGNEVSGNSIY